MSQPSNITLNITDADWEKLLEPKKVAASVQQANDIRKNLSKEQWHKLRVRSKRDLFFLSYGVLGYTRLSTNLHGGLCSWLQKNKNQRFREVLLPRGHFKSTVITISDSIRIVLPYTEEDQRYDDLKEIDPLPWPDTLGPDCRLLIAHETHNSASRYLFSITSHFLSNPTLMALFPDAVPNPRQHRINREELQLPRDKIWNEPTIDTMGVGAKGQGRHYNCLKLDDLIGDKARDSATEMENAKEWIDNIQAFFSTFGQDRFDLIGTRWANDDLYQHVEERYAEQLAVYCRAVEEINPATNKKEPIFPEEFTSQSLDILRKNRKVFSAQYENNPDSGATSFDESWIKWYGWQDRNIINVFGKDGIATGRGISRVNVRDLNVGILFDPAVSGKAGFVVAGMDSFRRVFVLEALQDEWPPNKIVNFIFEKVARWQPSVVAIEAVLFSELYKPWFEAEMRLRQTFFNIVPVSTKQKSKPVRVAALATPLSSGDIFFNEQFYSKGQDPRKADSDMIYQIKKFGTIKDYHILDALAYFSDVLTPGFSRQRWEQIKKEEQQQLDERDCVTGYSSM